ncbi:MAG: translocation/assembly module TamB domain-containing protein [Flavobacteriaceae bacterium]
MLLFIILVLLLSIPGVQNRLGKYATDRINNDFGTNINIEKIGLQFNGDIELKNIYIEDYKKDTLVNIVELNTSILSFKKAIYDNKLTFGDIDIIGMNLNIKTYKGEDQTNLDVFVNKLSDDNPSTSENEFLLSSSDISIINSKFKLSDENKETVDVLKFNDLNINATDFLILGPKVSARINQLTFKDSRGVSVQNMTTNFSYSRTSMVFDNLHIETPNSELNGDLKFKYNREDLQFFEDRVALIANFDNSRIALNELNTFYNEFGVNEVARIKATLTGTLNDLTANDLYVSTSRQTIIDGNVNFKNLFNKELGNFSMDGRFNKLASTYKDLRSLLPNVLGNSIPSVLDKLGRFDIQGNTKITTSNIDANIDVQTDLGIILAQLEIHNVNNIDDASYKGNIIFDEFLLGNILNDPKIGKVSLNVDADGKGFTLDNLNTLIKGDIYGLSYNDYYYSNIDINGTVKNKIFNGDLAAKDDNLDFTFNGLVNFSENENNYNFTANVNYANLNALNFVKKDSISMFRGLVKMDMKGTNIDDAYGSITFQNTLYTNQNDEYYFKDFEITSSFNDNERTLYVNSPDIIEGTMKGKFKINDVTKLVENSLGNIYTNYNPHLINSNQYIDFNFKIYNKIAEVFYPDLKFGSNTFFRGRIESDAKEFNLTFKSPEIRFAENFANNIQLRLSNKNPLYNTYIEIDSIGTKYYDISQFSLINLTLNDSLFIRSEFKGGKTNRDQFNLNLFYTINKDNQSVIGFKNSEINFKGNQWFINEDRNKDNKIVFDRLFKNFDIRDILMTHNNESIKLSGFIQGNETKNINLDFQDVDLTKVTPDIQDLLLAGNINGIVNIRQQNGNYIPESDITIDNFKVNDNNLGSFRANIVGNQTLTNYDVNISLKEDSNQSLSIVGNLDVAGKNSNIDLEVDFKDFILEPLNPFGDGVITEIRGYVTGNARVNGKLNRPQINGELTMDDGGLAIPYLNVNYSFEDETEIQLSNQSFIFNDAELTDTEFFSRANLSGRINHVNFSNWSIDLDINSNRLLVLNTQDSEDALYYGTAFVDGDINIAGPTNQLVIKADVSSEEGTVFKIPLSDTESLGDNSYIHFLSPEEKEAKLRGETLAVNEISGLEMDFDLTVNENAEIEIVMDRNSGSTIKGRGNGGILAQINTNGRFNMYGDFIITEGTYNFIYGGVIQKDFRVVQGGTLVWEGSPLQAEINIEAIHDNISANPSILLDNPINQSIPVEVKIHLTEKLELPTLDFDLIFPNVNSTIKSELEYRLSDKDEKQFQALSLLATGSFRSDLSTLGGQDALGLISDRVTTMLNDIISSENGKLDIGLNLEIGENNPNYVTDSRVGFTLSTQLSDRVLINGKVGVPVGGVNETVIAGNFEVEVLLNDDRTLSLKFFNKENSIQNFGEQIGYTQGLGLSYNVEFDNLNELFKKLFKKKESVLNTTPKKQNKSSETGLSEYNTFKKKDSTNVQKSNNF